MLKSKLYHAFVFSAIALVLWGCGLQAHVQKTPGTDLDNYRTFNWIDDEPKANSKEYVNFEESYLKRSIAEELTKKGYREVKGNADVSIDYDVMIENSQYLKREAVYSQPFVDYRYNPYTRRIQPVYYPSRYIGDNSYTVPYKSGTITVNLVDNKTKEVAWQGWAETEVDRKKLTTSEIDQTITAIFRKFK